MHIIFESKNIQYIEVDINLLDDYLKMVNDIENVGKYIGCTDLYSKEEEINFINSKLKAKAPIFSMIEKSSGEFIGNVEIMDPHDGIGELGIAITKDKQDKGYGKEAIKAIIEYANKVLNINHIFLKAYLYNLRAIHVYTECGFIEKERNDKKVIMVLKNCD
ncbi:MAG: GNAT family N-acetyltransferase [Bacilli bacterium]|nr:GNAT family N-acetyltransferase [Bacilli bacterium]